MSRFTLLSCILGAAIASTLVGCETKVINQPPNEGKTVIYHENDSDHKPAVQNNIRVEDK